MKLKILSTITFIFLITLALTSQLNMIQSVKAIDDPMTPITSFAKQIEGEVIYKFLGRGRGTDEAENVKVEATELFTNKKFSTTTDANGHYVLEVEEGRYFVRASDDENTFFTPTIKYANVTKNDKDDVDFKGLIFP